MQKPRKKEYKNILNKPFLISNTDVDKNEVFFIDYFSRGVKINQYLLVNKE